MLLVIMVVVASTAWILKGVSLLHCFDLPGKHRKIDQFSSRHNPFEKHFHKNLKSSVIMSRRAVPILGAALAAGAGYYLYNAGGDPKAAQKHLEGLWKYQILTSIANIYLQLMHTKLPQRFKEVLMRRNLAQRKLEPEVKPTYDKLEINLTQL